MGNLSTNRKHIILADAGILIPASATIYSKQNSNSSFSQAQHFTENFQMYRQTKILLFIFFI